MKRRTFIQSSIGAGVTASLAGLQATESGVSRPNIIIIHCDEHNFRTLGCYRDTLSDEQAFMWGRESVCETPHIDSLAREGMLWTKCYPATPVCSPSRSSFLSGMFPQNTPVTNNNIHLSDDVVTFAQCLSEAGYHTGYAGKWHLDGYGKPQWEPERKFGFQDNRFMFNRGHWKQFEDTPDGPRVKARDRKGEPSYSVAGADETSFATDWLMTKAIEYVDEHAGAPFCYMLSIPDPHGPDTVRAPYDTMYDDSVVVKPRTYDKAAHQIPAWGKPQRKCPYRMASYHGMVKCIDDNVGRLIRHLREKGLYDRTMVIFTADHGDLRGEHGRQNKGVPFEGSAKVPFIIRFPGVIPGVTIVDHAFNTADFSPTLLSLAGVKNSGKEEGRDLSSVMQGGGLRAGEPDVTFFRSTSSEKGSGSWVGAVTPRFKLVLSPIEETWLFDLKEEPDELVNHLANPEHRDAVVEMARQLRAYAEATGDRFLLENEKVKASLRELAG